MVIEIMHGYSGDAWLWWLFMFLVEMHGYSCNAMGDEIEVID